MQQSGKTRAAYIVVLIHATFGSALLAQAGNGAPTQIAEQIRARQTKFNELLQSIEIREGADKDPRSATPTLLYRTRQGYVRFLLMPRSSHIEVTKRQDWKREDIGDAFVSQWKALFTSDSPAMQFKRRRVVHREDYSVITYAQEYGGLEVHAASVVVQVNKAGGVDAVNTDVMRDASAFETQLRIAHRPVTWIHYFAGAPADMGCIMVSMA